jgi:hypothetical protein
MMVGLLEFKSLGFVAVADGSRFREIRGFSLCESLRRIEIPNCVEIIERFHSCSTLIVIIFECDSRMCKIHGFACCISLCEIEFPASVEIVHGFRYGKPFPTITFETGSCLRELRGVECCESICEMDIPASVEIINGFAKSSIRQFTLAQGMKIERIEKERMEKETNPRLNAFIVYDEGDLQKCRGWVNRNEQSKFDQKVS